MALIAKRTATMSEPPTEPQSHPLPAHPTADKPRPPPRRRSSYPPAAPTASVLPWLMGESASKAEGTGWTPLNHIWDQLLTKDEPKEGPAILQAPPLTPGKRNILQAGNTEWKTALASHVEVDGVGALPVIKVLQEVWKRGGGDSVTALCLWPSIIIALGMPADHSSDVRVAPPSAQSAMSLQQLYNLTIRHWEPSIFSGLLGAYAAGTIPPPLPQGQSQAQGQAQMDRSFSSQHYGPSTPMRETDLTQWINLTPGAWSAQHDPFVGSAGGQNALFSRRKSSLAGLGGLGSFPFPFQLDEGEGEAGGERGGGVEENHVAGLEELLAGMEDQRDAQAQGQEQDTKPFADTTTQAFNLPTPETTSGSPSADGALNKLAFSPPTTMSSPFVTAGSSTSAPSIPAPAPAPLSVPAPAPAPAPAIGKPHPKTRPPQLSIPPADFVPPPPMCMFFKSSFQDLTADGGKVGIWKGDLDVRGRGGGRFSVLVVGEQGFDHLWQSSSWPQQLSYPMRQVSPNDCYTSSMIPVSHLAREGLVPITMGMVLCNEPADRIDPYVKMVHGLHAEGVAFHLPCENPRLPVVFLPAKFHANDPLLRLGVAFMGKAGLPYPAAPLALPSNSSRTEEDTEDTGDAGDEPSRKKKKKNAPVGKSKRKGSRD
ncbi:hypothetical protein IAR50_002037 [Cryptococcus sp. DSM 104548]